MTIAYAETLRDNQLDEIAARAGNAALLRIYNGSRPATGGAATTLLAELTCGSPFAGAASGGVLTASAIASDESADATGTATWFTAGPIAGILTVTEAGDVLAASGASTTPIFTGTLTTAEAADAPAAAGTFSAGSRQGTGAYSEAADTLAAVGTFTPVPTATGTVSLLPTRQATVVLAVPRVPTSGGVT